MYSNIYTNIIFIGMGVKITVYTEKNLETRFVLLKIRHFFLVSLWIIRVPFFPCTHNLIIIILCLDQHFHSFVVFLCPSIVF